MKTKKTKFFKLKYLDKSKKDTILKELQISKSEYAELIIACKADKKELDKISILYKRKNFINLSFTDFIKWFEEQDLKCYYCGIKQSEINSLINQGLVFTKRITTRGKRMELERILPNESYNNIENLKFCCYWCNNAKTDEFSEVEFINVAKEIRKIWENRLVQLSVDINT